MATPEQQARAEIDRLLAQAGWTVQDVRAADWHVARGAALRSFELNAGHSTANYLLYVDGIACGVIETVVGILREEWGRGDEFAQKITYRTTGRKPEELVKAFRTSYYPLTAFTNTRPN